MRHLLFIIAPQLLFSIIALIYLPHNYIWLVLTFVSWFLMYVMGEGIFLHRYFSHRSFETRPWIAKIFGTLATIGGYGSPIAFRAIHLGLHHKYTDNSVGFWYKEDITPPLLICRRLMREKYYVWLDNNTFLLFWGVFLALFVIDIRLVLYGLCLPSFIGFMCLGISNSFTHLVGTRRFDTNDNSRNIAILSWLTWQGGVLHNNHHALPNRYHDSHAWYEFDIGKYIIPLIATEPLTKTP